MIRGKDGILRQLSPSTINTKLYNLVRLFDLMIQHEVTVDNPVKTLLSSKVITPIKFEKKNTMLRLNEHMVAEFFSSEDVTPDIKIAIMLFMNTGVRVSEMLSIKKSNIVLKVEPDKSFYEIGLYTKGNQFQVKRLSLDAYNTIMRIYEDYSDEQKESEYLVAGNRGQSYTRQNFDIKVKNCAEKIFKKKVPISAHDFRRFKATRMWEDGVDLRTIQHYLGHRSIATTEIYIKGYRDPVVNEYIPNRKINGKIKELNHEDIDALVDEFNDKLKREEEE